VRTYDEINADIAALGRPAFPVIPSLVALGRWGHAIAEWRNNNPDGDARWELLLRELDDLEVARAAARRTESLGGSAAGIPSRTLTAALDPKPTPALAFALEWWAGEQPWCVMLGATGVGKSTAAAVVALKACAQKSTLWVPAAELAVRAGGFDGVAFGRRVKSVDLLVLDDVGQEHASDFARSVMAEVLMHRHENGERTVLTSNLTWQAFSARMGLRLADRIRSAARVSEFAGRSLR